MSSTLVRCTILLLCAALTADEASSAGRASDARESSNRKSGASAASSEDWRPELESWLARLKGNFRVKLEMPSQLKCSPLTATQACTTSKGSTGFTEAGCRGIGQGPGVYCTFDTLRSEPTDKAAGPGPVSGFSGKLPSRMLLGIDPVARKISVMVVDPGGPAYSETAALDGSTVNIKGRCDQSAGTKTSNFCSWSLSIRAPSDGRNIVMTRTSSFGTQIRSEESYTFVLSHLE
jgi:hypothetical protein